MGAGSAWGSREELLHPRDSHGRFRSSWKMAEGVVNKIMALLDKFNPKTFASDQEAQNYVHGISRGRGRTHKPGIDSFLRNFANVNKKLEAGDTSDPSVKLVDSEMQPIPDDLILTRTMTPESFGLNAQNVAQIEELTGKLVNSKGYTSTNIGTPEARQPGRITMTIATPAGTKALIPNSSQPSKEVVLGRDQPLRVTKVDPDGAGGWNVLAVAAGDSDGETPVDLAKAVPGDDVPETPEVPAGGDTSQAPANGTPGAGAAIPARTGKPGRPAGPGPGPRNDGHVGVVGPGAGAGTGAGPEGGTAEVPAVDLPETPESGPDSRGTFREAFDKADIKVPTVGTRRKQFMDAYNGVASGKKTPQEAVADLDNAITMNKKIHASDLADGTDPGPLPEDIKRQQALRDLIAEHFNFTGRKQFKEKESGGEVKKPVAKKAPAKAVAKKAAASQETPEGLRDQARKLLEGDNSRSTRLEAEKLTRRADQLEAAKKPELKAPEKKTETGGGKLELSEADFKKTTIAQMRQHAKDNDIHIPGNVRLKKDIFDHIVKEIARKELEKRRGGGEKKSDLPNPENLTGRDLEVDQAIRNGFLKHRKPSGFASIGRIRQDLDEAGFSRKEQNDAFGRIGRGRKDPYARVIPVADMKSLDDVDRKGAFRMGGEDNHAIRFLDMEEEKKTPEIKKPTLRKRSQKTLTPERREEIATELEGLRERLKKIPLSSQRELGLASISEVVDGWIDKVRKGELNQDDIEGMLNRLAGVRYGTSNDPDTKKISNELSDTLRRLRGEDIKAPEIKKPTEKGLIFMTVPEIRQRAKDKNLKIPGDLKTKKDIVDWLTDAEVAQERGEEIPKSRGQLEREQLRVHKEAQEIERKRNIKVGFDRRSKEIKAEKEAVKKRVALTPAEKVPTAYQQKLRQDRINKLLNELSDAGRPPTARFQRKKIEPQDRNLFERLEAATRQSDRLDKLQARWNELVKDVETEDDVKQLLEQVSQWVKVEKDQNLFHGEKSEGVLDSIERAADAGDFEGTRAAIRLKRQEADEMLKMRMSDISDETKAAKREQLLKTRAERRETRLAETRAAREKAAAARQQEAEKKRAAVEAQKAAEEKKKAAAAAAAAKKKAADAEELKLQRERDKNRYDPLTGSRWTMAELRKYAQANGFRLPNSAVSKDDVRKAIIRERIRKNATDLVNEIGLSGVLQMARRDGIVIPEFHKTNPYGAATWLESSKQVVAWLGIDPKKYKPRAPHSGFNTNSLNQPSPNLYDSLTGGVDTDPNHPVHITDFEIYTLNSDKRAVIKNGLVHRRNGVTYLTDIGDGDPNSPYRAAMITYSFEEFHNTLPAGSTEIQSAYAWIRDANPNDDYWKAQFNSPDHESFASAGNGTVAIWGRWQDESSQATARGREESMTHEYGHNVDNLRAFALGLNSEGPQWKNATQKPVAPKYQPGSFTWHEHTGITMEPDADRGFPNGVTTYGKSSVKEDFAESMELYWRGILGTARRKSDGKLEIVYFRDIFPERAAILDKLFPAFASKQKAERVESRRGEILER